MGQRRYSLGGYQLPVSVTSNGQSAMSNWTESRCRVLSNRQSPIAASEASPPHTSTSTIAAEKSSVRYTLEKRNRVIARVRSAISQTDTATKAKPSTTADHR